jgi:hypothetical protein
MTHENRKWGEKEEEGKGRVLACGMVVMSSS